MATDTALWGLPYCPVQVVSEELRGYVPSAHDRLLKIVAAHQLLGRRSVGLDLGTASDPQEPSFDGHLGATSS